MTSRTYMSSPDVTRAEEDALVRALRSGWVAPLGPEVDAYEAELAEVQQTQVERRRARAERHRERPSGHLGELSFEGVDLRAERGNPS